MGRISSGIGLITGIPIKDTVEQLIAIQARPRDLLRSRTDRLTQQQTAITDLTARVLAVQLAADHLGSEALYGAVDVTSSDDDFLTATATGDVAPGSYPFTPVQLARTHQALSSGFAAATDLVGEGSLVFRFGGAVDKGVDLALLNAGQGVARGKIRITDRGGKSTEIDLGFARTIDDVVQAINGAGSIDVTAEVHGDRIRLVDHSGQTTSNLRVHEVGLGRTAADLGLANVNVAADFADGQDILRLHRGLALSQLNDGHGVRIDANLHDIELALADGTTIQVDVPSSARTLGDVIDAISSAAAGKVRAEIGPDGDRLVLTDLTTGASVFDVRDANGSLFASDLGLTRDALGGVVTGGRLLGGLNSVLLANLGGGNGLGSLGDLDIQDRAGNDDTVNLAGAETLQDVVDRINQSTIGVRASVNSSRTGILLADTTGSTAGNLIVRNGDSQTETADKLGLTLDAAVDSIDGGDLGLRLVGENTLLSSLNGGAGVDRGRIRITDSAGGTNTLDFSLGDVKTVGDVIDAINALAV
ncbi:MAG: flagellar cap protein FliD N-terminal domain-containing protein, partial [Pirellulales bacterium]